MADFLLEVRFIDDLNDSLANLTDAEALEKAVDEPFAEYSAECKGWAITGLPPPPEISEDGIVGVAGMAWHPETDYIELKIQQLHFGKIVSCKTQLFKDGSSAMENFVPRKLTKRTPPYFLEPCNKNTYFLEPLLGKGTLICHLG